MPADCCILPLSRRFGLYFSLCCFQLTAVVFLLCLIPYRCEEYCGIIHAKGQNSNSTSLKQNCFEVSCTDLCVMSLLSFPNPWQVIKRWREKRDFGFFFWPHTEEITPSEFTIWYPSLKAVPSMLLLAIAPWGESFHGAYMVIGILADTLGTESMMSKAWIAAAWAKPLSLWVVNDSMC